MQLTPLIAVHLTSALAALVTGPFALWARLGRMQRPALHRAMGYTWVVLMVTTAVTALFIRDFHLPNVWGYTPIHLFVVLTFASLWQAFRALARRNIKAHRRAMLGLYMGGCVGAGLFTLLPGRLLGQWVWGHWLSALLALWACSVSQAKDFTPTVGMRVLQSGDMPITVVYPAQELARHHTLGPFEIDVAMDAPPVAGNLRLIVLSHGTASHALPDFALAASLARAGFVVAQPRHRGDNALDAAKAGPEAWVTRPQEVSETIDRVLADPALGAVTDHQRVGVHGMSAGGATALTMAGGRWRTLNLVQHCNAHWDEDIGFCANGLAEKPQELADRRRRIEEARNVPPLFLPRSLTQWHGGPATPSAASGLPSVASDERPDPRVKAVTASVPVAAIFDNKSLANIAIPVGVVQADADQVLVPRFHAQYLLAHCPRCTELYTLKGAGHFDLMSPWPESVARRVAAQQMRGGERSPGVSDALRQEVFDSIVQFYRQHLP